MDVCRRAWRVAYRDKPAIVPFENPFARMEITYKPKQTRAASYDDFSFKSLATGGQLAQIPDTAPAER